MPGRTVLQAIRAATLLDEPIEVADIHRESAESAESAIRVDGVREDR